MDSAGKWTQARSVLNHDALKNRLIPGAHALMRAVNHDAEEDIGNLLDERIVSVWDIYRQDFFDFFLSTLILASPKKFFEWPPLSRCSLTTLRWLPNYIHEKWIKETGIEEWSEEGGLMVSGIDEILYRLRVAVNTSELGAKFDTSTAGMAAELRSEFFRLSEHLGVGRTKEWLL